MPIGKTGTPDHAQYRAVYHNLKPVVEKAGYSVLRADDVQKSGAITKDIVKRLGESDLVVADLTELNPNVFYELGVRHALRGKGTVMILDDKRTPDIPFDLSAYRVIKFSGDLTGIDVLAQALSQFLEEGTTDEPSRRDNPVHDWFPTLPVNVIENSDQAATAPLRQEIRALHDRLAAYEKAYGSDLPGMKSDKTPLSTVLATLSDAEDGLLPATIMDSARAAYESRDAVAFLQKIRVVLERDIRIAPGMFLNLAAYAAVMDLDEVRKAIFDQAIELYPSDRNLRRQHLLALAHSDSPGDRERAIRETPQELSIDISVESLEGESPEKVKHDLDLIAILLDAYHQADMRQEELLLAGKLVKVLPDSTRVLRNYGRALASNGLDAAALDYHRKSLFCPDVNDLSAIWFGNELHNRERHRDAAEAYAYGCLLDPNDAKNYSHLAEELSWWISESTRLLPIGGNPADVDVPEQVDPQRIVDLARCSASCMNLDADAADRIRQALNRLDLDLSDSYPPMSRGDRLACVQLLYTTLQTNLTTSGEEYAFDGPQGATLAD